MAERRAGPGLAVLDVISNALAALLLLFFVVVARQMSEPPAAAETQAVLVEAIGSGGLAEVALSVVGARGRAQAQPGARFFDRGPLAKTVLVDEVDPNSSALTVRVHAPKVSPAFSGSAHVDLRIWLGGRSIEASTAQPCAIQVREGGKSKWLSLTKTIDRECPNIDVAFAP